MKISYTKTVEFTTRQAILEANDFLASKKADCRFEIIKSRLNQYTIFVMVKDCWSEEYDGIKYYPSVTDDSRVFEKCLAQFLAEKYSG